MNIFRFLSYFAKNLSVNGDESSISQSSFLKIDSSSMAFETEIYFKTEFRDVS